MYLYHFMPKHMQGTVLYPLAIMKNKLPDVYKSQIAKYTGREHILKTNIPPLGTWVDVIHLSPIDPRQVMYELNIAGADTDFDWNAFRIDADTLERSKLVIMTTYKDHGAYKRTFHPFTENNYRQHNTVPELTKEYYRKCIATNEQPLTYGGAPHVFYKGEIDTTNVEIISGSSS